MLKYQMMRVRHDRRFTDHILIVILSILFLFGCSESPTTIVGSVGFLNPEANARMFPPDDVAPWDFTDDVCYVRIVDSDGAGVVVWESPAYPAADLDQFIYGNTLYPGEDNVTGDSGHHLESFVVTFTNAELAAMTMPLRIEAFLFDSPIVPPLNPADVLRYSYYDASGVGDPGWRISFTLSSGEIKTLYLLATVPFPP